MTLSDPEEPLATVCSAILEIVRSSVVPLGRSSPA